MKLNRIDKESHMNIAMGFREDYREHAYVTLYSLLINNVETYINIYLLSDELDINYFMCLEQQFNCTIYFCKVDVKNIKCIDCGKIGIGTLFRLFLAECLPEDIKKIIYIDADIIIHDSINKLWAQELFSHEFIAAVKCNVPVKHINELNINSDEYFNAGVLLFDLQKCRVANIFNTALEKLEVRHYDFFDQDVLNIVLNGHVRYIDSRWNFDSYRARTLLLENKTINSMTVSIYHYTGRSKPWDYQCINQFSWLYFEYLGKALGKKLTFKPSLSDRIYKKIIMFLHTNFITRMVVSLVRNYIRT